MGRLLCKSRICQPRRQYKWWSYQSVAWGGSEQLQFHAGGGATVAMQRGVPNKRRGDETR